MGIFDSVSFNPSGYSGLLGDLLSRLQFDQLGQSPGFGPQQQPQPQPQPVTNELSAQSVSPQQMQQQLPTALQAPSGGNFGAGVQGFLNAKSPLQAIGNLISGFSTGQRTDPAGMAQQSQLATYQALRAAGVPDGVAQAGALNPEVLKTIAPQIYTKPKFTQVSESPLGKQFGFVDEGRQTINGQPLGAGGSGSTSSDFLAPGVKQENTSLSGDAYLSQYSPQIQSAVKAYINGDVMPSGNPRLAGIAQFAKTVAQKYGQDMGIPVSDAAFAERRKYRTELGSNYAGSAGGQAKAFAQGIEHLSSLSDTLAKLENWNGFGIPILASASNSIRQGLSTDQQAIADKAASIGQTLAGEVGKLFSGTQGGGVREREETRARFDTVKSQAQLAAALDATLEVMRGGLSALEGRRDQILGPNSNVNFVNDKTAKQIAHVEDIISKLRGGQSATPSAKPAGQLPPGWSVQVH